MKKGIIVASFGTTHIETRKKCIDSIVDKVREAFPNFLVTSCFTSRIVKKRIEENEGISIFNEIEAKDYLLSQGVSQIYIQPLHIIPGFEYEKLLKLDCKLGKPLVYDDKSIEELASILSSYSKGVSVFAGHGTEHTADAFYQKLEDRINHKGLKTIIGTIEGEKTLDNVIEKLKHENIKEIDLYPLMLVAGDHAVNDISGEEDSWKKSIEAEGIKVNFHMKGLGQNLKVQEAYLERLRDLVGLGRLSLIGTGPGASDLLTLRAINRIKEADLIFVPVNNGKNIAFDTIREFVTDQEIVELDTPMKTIKAEEYDRNAEIIFNKLGNKKGIYITIGDAMIYSTAIYLLDRLKGRIVYETVPGTPAFLAAFDSLSLAITIKQDSFLMLDRLDSEREKLLDGVDSVAILKASMHTEEVLNILEKHKFTYYLFKRVSMHDQELLTKREDILANKDYISILIGRKK